MGPLHASTAPTLSDIRHRWVLFTPPLPLPPQTSDIIDGSSSRLRSLYLRRHPTSSMGPLHASAASTSADIRHHRWVLFTPPLPLPPQTSDIIDGSSSRLRCLYLRRHPTSSMGPLHASAASTFSDIRHHRWVLFAPPLPLPPQTSDIINGSSSRLHCPYLLDPSLPARPRGRT
ncbi:hypothetical protein CF326_g9730 [Tilletia indica]|nr:hypothetical protein CF326_g9730 [Tilletia indica]